jgi:hypothetical protein
MNIQEILTYLIVAIASGYGIFSLIKVLFPVKQDNQHGCSSGCNCDAVKVRKELLIHKQKVTG